MADVNPQDIMRMLQESANSQKSFADKLREQRLARTSELNQFQDQVNTPNDFQTPGGVPLNPADVINAKSLFAKSMQGALSPYSPELEQKALGSQADILAQIYQLSQADKKIAETTGGTIEDILKKQKALKDAGYDTSAIDKEIESVYGIKKSDSEDSILSKVEDKQARSKAAEYVAFMKDLKETKEKLSGNGLGSDLVTSQTGPLAQMLGQYGESGDVRTQIDKLNANVKSKTYGAAVSEGERKDANKWLPSSARQETQNTKRLEAIYNSKKNELTSLLRGQGLTENEINTYLDKMMVNNTTTTAPTAPVQDTLGIL